VKRAGSEDTLLALCQVQTGSVPKRTTSAYRCCHDYEHKREELSAGHVSK
jgi:hypothetical protein